jgi:hypothetical protein
METKTSTNSIALQESLIQDLSLPELTSLLGGVAPPSPTRPLPGANIPPMPTDVLLTIGQNPLAAALTITTSGPTTLNNAVQLLNRALGDLRGESPP